MFQEPAIVWQCRRTAEYCDSLKERGLTEMIRQKTGLLIDAYFSGTKIKWILDHVAGDSDCRNIRCIRPDFAHGLHCYAKLRGPNLLCVVFYPSGLREILWSVD